MRVTDRISGKPVVFELHSDTNRSGEMRHRLIITHDLEPDNPGPGAAVNRMYFELTDLDCAALTEWFSARHAESVGPSEEPCSCAAINRKAGTTVACCARCSPNQSRLAGIQAAVRHLEDVAGVRRDGGVGADVPTQTNTIHKPTLGAVIRCVYALPTHKVADRECVDRDLLLDDIYTLGHKP